MGARVVVLNGASSAGKTTLANSFRRARAAAGEFWFVIGIDDFLAKLPAEWTTVGSTRGRRADEGIRFEAVPDGLRVTVGSVGRDLIRAYQATVRAVALAGLNVMVDEVVIDRLSWDDWTIALAGLDAVWVGVRCSADVAEERSKLRDDRFAGLARVQTITAHEHARYAFEIDTTTRSPDEALRVLTRGLGYGVT